MSIRCLTGGFVIAATLASGLPAQAADLDTLYGQTEDTSLLPPPDYTFGSGWYLRGDLTATDDMRHDLGQLQDRTRDENWNYGLGAGAGYQFTSFLRGDITGDYLGNERNTYAYGAGSGLRTTLNRYDVMANAYFDLGTWAEFTPYIGAGVGFAGLHSKATLFDGQTGITTTLPGRDIYNLAWAAMAGVAYHVSPNLLVDIGYRYLNLGDYQPIRGGGNRTLDSHQVRAGLRYMLY